MQTVSPLPPIWDSSASGNSVSSEDQVGQADGPFLALLASLMLNPASAAAMAGGAGVRLAAEGEIGLPAAGEAACEPAGAVALRPHASMMGRMGEELTAAAETRPPRHKASGMLPEALPNMAQPSLHMDPAGGDRSTAAIPSALELDDASLGGLGAQVDAGPDSGALAHGFTPELADWNAGRMQGGALTPERSDFSPSRAPVVFTLPDPQGRRVTARLVLLGSGGAQDLRIELEPADLGRVEVALRLDDRGGAAAVFTVDRPETLQLLQRDARTVADMLAAAGFTLDQGSLGFMLRDGSGEPGQPGQPPAGPDVRSRSRLAGDDAQVPPTGTFVSRGLLDLRV